MEWEIQKRSKACARCEREFDEGDVYHCTLLIENGSPARHDTCDFCWKMNREEEESAEHISYWQSKVKPRLVQKKEDPIHQSVAEKLLRKYLHSSDPSHKNLCYVLAAMLERKKELVPRKTSETAQTGKKLVVYEHPKTGETILIEDPELSLSDIDKLQKQIGGILEMEQVALGQE